MEAPLRFDEKALVAALEKLPVTGRTAFAAACAGRLQATYVRFSDKTGRGTSGDFLKLLSRLWDDLDGSTVSSPDLDVLIGSCMALIPKDEDGPWDVEKPAAQEAGIALAYALRCRRTGLAKEAAWAARYAYEAIANHVLDYEGSDTGADVPKLQVLRPGQAKEVLARLKSHPLVQAELARQQRDLEELEICIEPGFVPDVSR
jgi:hypothetical protein